MEMTRRHPKMGLCKGVIWPLLNQCECLHALDFLSDRGEMGNLYGDADHTQDTAK